MAAELLASNIRVQTIVSPNATIFIYSLPLNIEELFQSLVNTGF